MQFIIHQLAELLFRQLTLSGSELDRYRLNNLLRSKLETKKWSPLRQMDFDSLFLEVHRHLLSRTAQASKAQKPRNPGIKLPHALNIELLAKMLGRHHLLGTARFDNSDLGRQNLSAALAKKLRTKLWSSVFSLHLQDFDKLLTELHKEILQFINSRPRPGVAR